MNGRRDPIFAIFGVQHRCTGTRRSTSRTLVHFRPFLVGAALPVVRDPCAKLALVDARVRERRGGPEVERAAHRADDTLEDERPDVRADRRRHTRRLLVGVLQVYHEAREQDREEAARVRTTLSGPRARTWKIGIDVRFGELRDEARVGFWVVELETCQ